MRLSLDQKGYDTFGVDLRAVILFDRHGGVCGCPQFWDLCTNAHNTDLPTSAQALDYDLGSGCQHSGNQFNLADAPTSRAVARANPSNQTNNPLLGPKFTAEPLSAPSRQCKETCIFWYHGTCRRGADCHLTHELNHNWPISRPPGYTHDRSRCELKFCPFRTDLTEMMQRYYSTARLGERIEEEEMDVDHHTATVVGEVTESESNETYEGESLIDSKSRSASGEVEDDGSGHDLLADTTLAPSSHTKDTVPSLVSASPQPSSLQALKRNKPLMSQVSHIKADTGEEEHEKPNQLSVHANEEQLNADPIIPVPGQGFRKRSRKERRNRARRTKLLTELKTRVPQPVSVGTVATSRSPLTPSPPGLPQVSLPPATSISHAGSQRCKRKASGQGDSAHTEMRPAKKRRQRGKKQAEELSAMQRHDLAHRAHRAQKRGAVPLKDRMTHPGPMGK